MNPKLKLVVTEDELDRKGERTRLAKSKTGYAA
jgi:hypothetical protein